MKYIKPFYYDEFKCVGGECKDTCCHGWNVFVDETSFQTYMETEGEFGEELRSALIKDESNRMALDETGRCKMLNSEGLCKIYINLGEDKMCNVCKIYPRMEKTIQELVECDLSLSCPEVARVLVTLEEDFDFSFGEDDKLNTQQAGKEETYLYNALIAGRSLSVDLMQIKEIPFWMRLYLCLNIADKIQAAIDRGECQKVKEDISSFQQAEYLSTIIQSLSGMTRNVSFQIGQYNFLIRIISELDITNATFKGLFLESAMFLEGQEEAGFEEKFQQLWEKFDDYIKEQRAFEHYAVYHLFHYYMNGYSDKQPYKYVAMMVETYALMRLYAMVRWMNQGFNLEQEDFIDIFYSCSRMIEHGRDVLSKLYKQMEEHEMNTKACLITLIR